MRVSISRRRRLREGARAMNALLIHFVLIHHGGASKPDAPRVLHFGVSPTAEVGPSGKAPVHLLVLDARRMNPACLRAAFAEAQRLRATPGFLHGVLVCDVPLLPIVQSAIRTGLRDIIQEPLTARQLVHLLRSATPGQRACARQVAALSAIVRTVAAADQPAVTPSAILARREYALVQRAERLDHREARLALERAALEEREEQLRASSRRLDRELVSSQADRDARRTARTSTATPFTASPFAVDLQAIATQLEERARALDIRERMLQEMEVLLTAQVAGSDAAGSPGW